MLNAIFDMVTRLGMRLLTTALLVAALNLPAFPASGFAADAAVEQTRDLIQAAAEGDLQRVGSLLDAEAPVDGRADVRIGELDCVGCTALMAAAGSGRADVARLLLERGAEATATDGQKMPALLYAILGGDTAVIDLFLERGVSPRTRLPLGHLGISPAELALLSGKVDALYQLVHRGAEQIDFGSPLMVERILNTGSDKALGDTLGAIRGRGVCANEQDPAVLLAAITGNATALQALLTSGAVDVKGRVAAVAALAAAERGETDAGAALVEAGVDANARTGPRLDPDTPDASLLGLASLLGDEVLVKKLLDRGAEANVRNRGDAVPLLMAAFGGHAGVVRLLLERDADARAQDDGGTALTKLVGAWGGGRPADQATVMLLVERGADVNAAPKNGNTPLVLAAISGDVGILRLLLDRGADVNGRGRDGNTALMLAAQLGKADVVTLLAERGADVNAVSERGRTALINAIGSGQADIVRFLRARGAAGALQAASGAELLNAAIGGKAAEVRALLDAGVPVNTTATGGGLTGWTALMIASAAGDEGTASLLLDRGADLALKDEILKATALVMAARSGSDPVVRLLLDKGAREKDLALSFAAAAGHAPVVQLLVKRGADVRRAPPGRAAPVIETAKRGQRQILVYLLDQGADPGTKDSFGISALMVAAREGKGEIVRTLIDRKADVLMKDEVGRTALAWAAEGAAAEALALLLDAGARIDEADARGETPLMRAARRGGADAVQLLLRRGATTAAKTADGATALRLAKRSGNWAVVRLLRNAGVNE